MSKVILMVGLPGSGKSTYANLLKGHVLSSDAIRGELYGDESIQGNPADVFSLLYTCANALTTNGEDVIVDATNLTRKVRRKVMRNIKADEYMCFIMNVPYEESCSRNRMRDRVVPQHVMDRMRRQYEEPTCEEGFSCIWKVSSFLKEG